VLGHFLESRHSQLPIDDGNQVGEGRVRRRKENAEIASGWLVALASLWIDPKRHRVFTGNVPKDNSGNKEDATGSNTSLCSNKSASSYQIPPTANGLDPENLTSWHKP
jgi:hypothetical protein